VIAALVLAALIGQQTPDAGVATPPPPPPATTPAPAAATEQAPEPGVGKTRARSEHTQGMARLRAGRLDEAAALFANAVAHDPANATFLTDYGFALGKLGRRAEAESALRTAIEKEPARFYAYVNLADLLAGDPARWERPDAALALLEKGLDATKNDRKGRFGLLVAIAGFERAVGRTGAARARLQPLLAPDAAPLTRAQRKRVLDLLDAIALDERAHALEDWPAPAPALARERLAHADALEREGRVDEAIRELEIVVNLAPSNAHAWRSLGRLLALHGGALELDRADEALRQALALEPAWTDLRELRARIARRRSASSPPAASAGAHHAPPSEHARTLYQEAEEWLDVGDPAGLGRDLLEQALADSPAFVPAALSLYALTGTVSPATVDALADDGPGLWALAAGVRKLGRPGATGAADSEALVRPWIDRAVALDVQDARFARAAARAAAGDRAGALADLVAYVAREPSPDHLEEARALRAGLSEPARHGATAADARAAPQLVARIRLLEERPDAALRALGGPCAPGIAPDRLLALGLVHEYADRRAAARACYELAGDVGIERLARLDARLPDGELGGVAAVDRQPLARAADRGSAAAAWTMARLAARDGDTATALLATDRALALAAAAPNEADLWTPDAQTAAARWRYAAWDAARARRERRRYAVLWGAVLLLAAVLTWARWRWRGRTVSAALAHRPALFPEVARAVAEIRHDVLKHRAGVLGLIADDEQERRAEIARAMLQPQPTSAVVAGIYQHLAQAAGGVGVTLRPLGREPVFGALARDLARTETLLERPSGGVPELLELDGRLRGPHAEALAGLLRQGPRTRVDAAVLSAWITAVEAERRQSSAAWTAPALALAEMALEFPVEEPALAAIFANLLRNAEAAVAGATPGAPAPRVLIRLDRERDVTGRQSVGLYVGDSAAAALSMADVEGRESGRGLAIVRDLVRQWRGQLTVRPEPAPLTKVVGASFPL
jgi:tetratricopeptide (TPR) repeat protein